MPRDKEFRDIERSLLADPVGSLKIMELTARSRVEGRRVFLEVLEDRQSWNQAGPLLQDLAVKEVGEIIGPAFRWLKTQEYACGGEEHRIASFEHLSTRIVFQLIPGGSLTMGDVTCDLDSNTRIPHKTSPSRHSVKPFLLANFPVTYENWMLGGGQEDFESYLLDRPLEGLSFQSASTWISELGAGFRIPSEVEWEYACRAGTQFRYFWGQEENNSYCWYRLNSDQHPHAMREHADKFNAFGLIDMLGNVMEWCDPVLDQPVFDQRMPQQSSQVRVLRGGAWFSAAPQFCRCAWRMHGRHGPRYSHMSFRLAYSLRA